MKKNRKHYNFPPGYSTTRAILDILLAFGESTPLFASPYQKWKLQSRKEFGMPDPGVWRYKRAIRYLDQTRQIEIRSKGRKQFFKLTKKGKLNALLKKLEAKQRPEKWDGKWRVIVWDIPESSRKQRDQIRHFVKTRGFFQLQLSVFITPFPLPVDAVAYLRESELINFVRFLLVEKMDYETELIKHFKLTGFSRS